MSYVYRDYIRCHGSGDTFKVDIDPGTNNKTYYDASIDAVDLIMGQHLGSVYLMYSGGVDSEYTLSLFRQFCVPVIPVILRLNSGYNAHDVAYADKFCASRNITPKYIDLDYDKFVESGLMYETAIQMHSSKFQYAATAWAIGQLDGPVFCGDGEPYIRLNHETQRWDFMVHEYEYALTNYYTLHNIPGTPHFNRYTKDMFYGFLADPRIKELANNQVAGKTSSFSSKWIVYNRHSRFNLEERPKYHGYEGIEQRPIYQHESFRLLEQIGKQWDGVHSQDFLTFYHNAYDNMGAWITT